MRGPAEDCQRQGIAFLPLVMESMGGWHATAERQVKKLGSCLARHTGQSEEEAISHLWGRLGILLQRGNAAMATLGCTWLHLAVPGCIGCTWLYLTGSYCTWLHLTPLFLKGSLF